MLVVPARAPGTEMTVSHWPNIVVGSGGESYIVSHFVQSIFSGSWVGMREKLNSVRWMC